MIFLYACRTIAWNTINGNPVPDSFVSNYPLEVFPTGSYVSAEFCSQIHVHANNVRALKDIGGFVTAPLMEMSYIRSDKVTRAPSRTFYPTEFDAPNIPSKPETNLWFYPYLPGI